MTKKLGYALISGFFSIAAALPAVAAEKGIQEIFNSLGDAVRTNNTQVIYENITQNSQSTVNRLLGYGMESCLPQNLSYTSERYEGDYVYVTAASPSQDGRELTTQVAFKNENAKWKLDVPESFRVSMGSDWESKLGQMEVVYTSLQQQFGGQINCSMVQNLLSGAPAAGGSGMPFSIPGMVGQ